MVEGKPADAVAKAAERRKKIGMMAKRMATQEGHDWGTLSKDDRKMFNERARERVKARRAERAAPTG